MVSAGLKLLLVSLLASALFVAIFYFSVSSPNLEDPDTIRGSLPAFFKINVKENEVDDKPTVAYSVRHHSRRHPAVRPLERQYHASTAMSAKFRSLSPRPINIWYDDGGEGVENGHLNLGQETTTNTYEGHVFFFTDASDKSKVLARYKMDANKSLYVIEDPDRPAPKLLKKRTEDEEHFMADYFNRTGMLWRHYYGPDGPRPPPKLFMWPAAQVGEVHTVLSKHGHWFCEGPKEQCQSTEPMAVELEVISLRPRAFIINNLFSEFEADHVIDIARPTVAHSSVGDAETGAFESDTRTSSNTWVRRGTSAITETLFRRAADVLQVDQKHLTRNTGAEDLQVVYYKHAQKYDSHHDWGVNGYPESRLITLLFYLSNQVNEAAGGETAFPKSEEGPIKVQPGKGSAVLFYDLLPDGNGDDLSLHASLPVHSGEKWLANFWVWDPKFR